MELPFTHVYKGLEFTFIKRPCRKDMYGHQTAACQQVMVQGVSNSDRIKSQTFTLCKHLIEGFDIKEWERREEQHADWINEDARKKEAARQLREDAQTRPEDRVYRVPSHLNWGDFGPDFRFAIDVKGLTRDEAIRLYAMADAIKGERD